MVGERRCRYGRRRSAVFVSVDRRCVIADRRASGCDIYIGENLKFTSYVHMFFMFRKATTNPHCCPSKEDQTTCKE